MKRVLLTAVIGGIMVFNCLEGFARFEKDDKGKVSKSEKDDGSMTVNKEEFKDGKYTGTAKGHVGIIKVGVIISGGKIKTVKILKNKENRPKTSLKALPKEIIKMNGTKGVDAVTGATDTSKAVIKAVNVALLKAKKALEKSKEPAEKKPADVKK